MCWIKSIIQSGKNTSVSLSSIKVEISNFVASVKTSVETIKSMNSECVEEALAKFKVDLSLSNAIAFINQYESRRAEILQREKERRAAQEEEARQRKLEAERAAAQEKERIEQERKKTGGKQFCIYGRSYGGNRR